MVQMKKRKKVSRMRGGANYGWGFKKKNRGSGHKGGVGMAGTGKRASQKVQYGQIIAREAGFEAYFGKRGFTSAPTAKKPNLVVNLDDIQRNHFGEKDIKLVGYKILGEGEGFAGTITAKSASKSAIEKMQKAGGKIIIEVDKERKDKPKIIERKEKDKKTGKKAKK